MPNTMLATYPDSAALYRVFFNSEEEMVAIPNHLVNQGNYSQLVAMIRQHLAEPRSS